MMKCDNTAVVIRRSLVFMSFTPKFALAGDDKILSVVTSNTNRAPNRSST